MKKKEKIKLHKKKGRKENSTLASKPNLQLPPSNDTVVPPLQVIHPTSQINTMEVHHHGHVHEQKKWKEYLFQFFMLFLAVFCGFLAEYQLEHVVENNREKQFMAALVRDLELDTIQLNLIRNTRLGNIQKIDSTLIFFASSNDRTSIPFSSTKHMQLGLRSFYQNSGTLDQLKNSGGLRLIRKRVIVDSIQAYDQSIKRMVLRDDAETNTVFDNRKIMEKMIESRVMAKIFVDSVFYNKRNNHNTSVKIKNELLDEYLNSIITCRNSYQGNLNLQSGIKSRAANLIELIKKEYHLKN